MEAETDLKLTFEQIVDQALELLREDGMGNLSMRRLADRLGAGAMSLYWHVESKEDVFDLALDAVPGPAVPDTSARP